jgi:SDR family mycofactocin-dependent oxidoreductase
MGRVEGKVVAITGAGRGQGRSHAVRLAEEGADIIALDICQDIDIAEYPMSSSEDLLETARLVEKTGQRIFTKEVDVRDRVALEAAFDEGVAELGHLDVVVANAAIGTPGAERPLRSFIDTIDVNLIGSLNTVHAAFPHLREGASIILIGSAAAYMAVYGESGPMGPGGMAYPFAKQTMGNYMNWFAPFLAPAGLRINMVHPTNCDTDMLQNEAMYKIFRPDVEKPVRADAEPGFSQVQAMSIPYVDPIDISHAVTYLASDESRYVTGLALKVDGGAVVKFGK